MEHHSGTEICKVTPFDRVLFVRKSGIYTVCNVPEKIFVDSGMWYCGFAEKEEISKVLFTIIYRDPKTQYAYIKRCRIEQYIMNKDYMLAPDGMEVLYIGTAKDFSFKLHYLAKPRVKILEETFKASSYEEKGLKAQGVRLSNREAVKFELVKAKTAAKKKETEE